MASIPAGAQIRGMAVNPNSSAAGTVRRGLAGMALLVVGCAAPAPSPFGSGESGARSGGQGDHTVRFQASCDECVLTWSVGERGGSVRDRALFSHTVRISLRAGETVEAAVHAAPVRGSVNWVRISYDGHEVAEARTEDAGASPRGGLTARALLEGDDRQETGVDGGPRPGFVR